MKLHFVDLSLFMRGRPFREKFEDFFPRKVEHQVEYIFQRNFCFVVFDFIAGVFFQVAISWDYEILVAMENLL